MNTKNNKGIINKHFLTSLVLFIAIIIVVTTFTSFLKDAQKNDKSLNKIDKKQVKI